MDNYDASGTEILAIVFGYFGLTFPNSLIERDFQPMFPLTFLHTGPGSFLDWSKYLAVVGHKRVDAASPKGWKKTDES